MVETPMAQRAANDEDILSFIKTKQPWMEKNGQPEDLDGLAVYFMSEQSKFTTGQLWRLTVVGALANDLLIKAGIKK